MGSEMCIRDRAEVLERTKMSLIPIKRDFIESIKTNPDFYGPFWILTTIIFLLGSAGNFASYLMHIGDEEEIFNFNLSLVRIGVGVVYPFGFGVPTLLYFILKFTGGQRLSLPEVTFFLIDFLVDLHLRVLVFGLRDHLHLVHYSVRGGAVAADGGRNVRDYGLFGAEPAGVFG